MIRRATLEDMPDVVRLADEFRAYSPYSAIPLDEDAFTAFAARLIEHGVILMSEDGLLGGCLNPIYFNPAYVFAAELFWWARKGGQDLLRAFEGWAQEQGAVGVQFTGLRDDHSRAIERVFRRAGYAPIETAFIKRF